jgi:hypothetical protein
MTSPLKRKLEIDTGSPLGNFDQSPSSVASPEQSFNASCQYLSGISQELNNFFSCVHKPSKLDIEHRIVICLKDMDRKKHLKNDLDTKKDFIKEVFFLFCKYHPDIKVAPLSDQRSFFIKTLQNTQVNMHSNFSSEELTGINPSGIEEIKATILEANKLEF